MESIYISVGKSFLKRDLYGIGTYVVIPTSNMLNSDDFTEKKDNTIAANSYNVTTVESENSIRATAVTNALKWYSSNLSPNLAKATTVQIHVNDIDFVNTCKGISKLEDFIKIIKTKQRTTSHDNWAEMFGIIDGLREMKVSISIKLTVNSVDHANNMRRANALALRGATSATTNTNGVDWEILPDKKYNRPSTKQMPSLLADNLIFYRAGTDKSKEAIYTGSGNFYKNPNLADDVKATPDVSYIGHMAHLKYLGRPSANDRCSVVILNEPDKLLHDVREYQDKVVTDIYGYDHLTVIDLKALKTAPVGGTIHRLGVESLGVTPSGGLLSTAPVRTALSHVFHPPRNAFLLMDSFQDAEYNLGWLMKSQKSLDGHSFTVTDIRDEFGLDGAVVMPTGETLKVRVGTSLKEKPVMIKLVVGKDIPTWTALKRIMKTIIGIWVVTKPIGEYGFNYSLLIHNSEGWMLWSCPQGSKHWLPRLHNKKK